MVSVSRQVHRLKWEIYPPPSKGPIFQPTGLLRELNRIIKMASIKPLSLRSTTMASRAMLASHGLRATARSSLKLWPRAATERSFAAATEAARFDWEDPLATANLLTEEEISVSETAERYCQEHLLPRVTRTTSPPLSRLAGGKESFR